MWITVGAYGFANVVQYVCLLVDMLGGLPQIMQPVTGDPYRKMYKKQH